MLPIRRILVAVKDPSAKHLPAVDRAGELARAFGARLELFHGITERLAMGPRPAQEGSARGAQHSIHSRYDEALARLAQHLSASGLAVRVRAEFDFPAHEAIVRRTRRVKADLIVAECHAARPFAHTSFHVTDWELLRTSPVPVLLVKSPKPYEQPVVLAALDPSHVFSKPAKLDNVILNAADRFSRTLGGTLHALHAYSPSPIALEPVPRAAPLATPATLPELAAKAERNLRRAVRNRIPAVRQHLVPDIAAHAIPSIARRIGAGLVVMGDVSRSGMQRWLIGNTAERVLNDLPCDVLVVKPRRFVSLVERKPRGARLTVRPPL
jgi:universal stress protein E